MIDLQKSGQGLEGYGMLHAQLESLLADERTSSPMPRSSRRFCSISSMN